MEFIFEFICELILEGSIDVSSNKKISKLIRYPLIFLIVIFFLSVIGLILFLGIILFNKNIIASLFVICVGVVLLISSIIKFRKIYIKKENRN